MNVKGPVLEGPGTHFSNGKQREVMIMSPGGPMCPSRGLGVCTAQHTVYVRSDSSDPHSLEGML